MIPRKVRPGSGVAGARARVSVGGRHILLQSIVATILVSALPATAHAGAIVVNSLADVVANDGACTLREAVRSADTNKPSGTVAGECVAGGVSDVVDMSALSGVITLNGSEILVTRPVTLVGPGAAALTINGAGRSRVFTFLNDAGPSVVRGVTVENGAMHADRAGGGALWAEASLTLDQVVVAESSTSGLRALGGGVLAQAPLTLIDSTVTRNATSGSGAHGAGIALLSAAASLTLIRSTVSDNATGAESTVGGGIYSSRAKVSVSNSTLSSNTTALDGGGIFISGAPLTLVSSTVANNLGNVGVDAIAASSAKVTAINSIIAQWGTADVACNVVVAGGANTIVGSRNVGDRSCGPTAVSIDQLGLLEGLAGNGGLTPTHALSPSSIGIDAGDQGLCASSGIDVDQRGFARDTHCDVGAYEYAASANNDATPDPFDFGAGTSATPGEWVTSPFVTLSGLGTSTRITVSGGEWQPEGGTWTQAEGVVGPQAAVRVRVRSGTTFNEVTRVRLCAGLAGEVCGDFSVQLVQDKDERIADLERHIAEIEEAHQLVVAELHGQIDALEAEGDRKDAALADLNEQIDALRAELEAALDPEEQKALEERIAVLEASEAAKTEEIATLKKALQDADAKLAAMQKEFEGQVAALKGQVDVLTKSGEAKDAEIATLKTALEDADAKLAATQKQFEAEIAALKGQVEALTKSGEAKDAEIATLKTALEDADAKLAATQKQFEAEVATLKGQVEALTKSGEAKDAEIAALKNVSDSQGALIACLQQYDPGAALSDALEACSAP